ncbi:MAG TPA: RHS repeat-associated core domain-containing protein [Acidimicrobiales bacterium]|nr:RHS repeat-associated core domain-containing protein [Acidimicrobiales bacterium]
MGLGVAKTGTASTSYTRDNRGSLVAQRTPDGTFYYLFDGLGSVVGLVNASGTKVASYAYDPYGRQTSAEPAVANPWRFAGGYHDTQTDLTKFGTRYYDPAVGRWTQQDPLAGSIADPTTMNRYAYVGGNPVNYVDPSGRFSITDVIDTALNVLDAVDLVTSESLEEFEAEIASTLTGLAVGATCAVGVELVSGGTGTPLALLGCTALGQAASVTVEGLILEV